jgi:hypothetical protein
MMMPHFDEIQVSPLQNSFLHNGNVLFERQFKQVLKFHKEGLAAVADEAGWFHIKLNGEALYEKRYARTFGYYYGRAAVDDAGTWFHLDTDGQAAYQHRYAWCGNFQESLCTVRDKDGSYFHINLDGEKLYVARYRYAGDFKDGAACVRLLDGLWRHIDPKGKFIHPEKYLDLGIFHKSFATAKDESGWMHIDRAGHPIYEARFISVEPFYNGQSLVEMPEGNKAVIDERGNVVARL